MRWRGQGVSISGESTSQQLDITRHTGEGTASSRIPSTAHQGVGAERSSGAAAQGLLGSGSLLGTFPLIYLSSSERRRRDAYHSMIPPTREGSEPHRSLSPLVQRAGTSCTAGKQGQASLENKWPKTQSLCSQGQKSPCLQLGGFKSAGMGGQWIDGALEAGFSQISLQWGKSHNNSCRQQQSC